MPAIYISEPNHFYTFELPIVPGAEVLIGTSPSCQLALPGVEGLGEVHACISCQPQGYVLTDMGTPYGTLANGVPIHSEYLMHGMEYRLGAAVITLVPEEAAMPQQMGAPMPQPMPVPQAQVAPAAAAAPKKKVVKKLSSSVKPAAAAPLKGKKAAAGGKEDMDALAERYNRNNSGSGTALFNLIYVIVLLLAAVYAGVALRHFERTGNFLPGIVEDGK